MCHFVFFCFAPVSDLWRQACQCFCFFFCFWLCWRESVVSPPLCMFCTGIGARTGVLDLYRSFCPFMSRDLSCLSLVLNDHWYLNVSRLLASMISQSCNNLCSESAFWEDLIALILYLLQSPVFVVPYKTRWSVAVVLVWCSLPPTCCCALLVEAASPPRCGGAQAQMPQSPVSQQGRPPSRLLLRSLCRRSHRPAAALLRT
mmetsp:Transcript_57450/g.125813  ORF Transcript_57450/g.125813 Transcript_57450/m.125813 type:complete len:202 (+) Transcript_57450:591-1196(+)